MASAQELAATGVVVGMKQLTDDVVPRVDIDVLLTTKPDTFNLFLQAMSDLQRDPNLLGYYSLAGIHGLPTNTWDDVGRAFRTPYYCAHGVLIFPTWHRPYLSLVEQTIYQKMVEIAGQYDEPHRQRYLDAAKAFRLPYYDYFRPRGGEVQLPGVGSGTFPYDFRMPDILNEPKVALRLPPLDEITYGIENPLYTYKFSDAHGQLPQADQDMISGSYSTTQTVRWPRSLSSDEHDVPALSNSLNRGREGRSSLTLDLLDSAPYREFTTVASDRLTRGDLTEFRLATNPNASGSLEAIHGNYHLLIGGNGHMRTPPISAFDPVFWFHHAQIDRLWALWQAFHPDKWFPIPQPGPGGVAVLAENQKDLLPFYKSRTGPGAGTFHSSDDSRATETYGYVYDDFKGVPAGDLDALRTRVDSKYIWSIRTPAHPTITPPPDEMKPLEVRSTYFFSSAPAPESTVAADTAQSVLGDARERAAPALAASLANPPQIDPRFDREWYVDSIVQRSAANGPFTIYFFLAEHGALQDGGDAPTRGYAESPYLAGLNHIFVAPSELCDNCGDQEAAGLLATDTANITPLLLDYLDLPDNRLESLQPEHVKPFLVKHLRWRVVFGGDQVKDPRQLAREADLLINVSAKAYHDNGPNTYETYPEVVEEIKANAVPPAGA